MSIKSETKVVSENVKLDIPAVTITSVDNHPKLIAENMVEELNKTILNEWDGSISCVDMEQIMRSVEYSEPVTIDYTNEWDKSPIIELALRLLEKNYTEVGWVLTRYDNVFGSVPRWGRWYSTDLRISHSHVSDYNE